VQTDVSAESGFFTEAGHGDRSTNFRFEFGAAFLVSAFIPNRRESVEPPLGAARIRLEYPDMNVIGGCCVIMMWSPRTPGDFFPRLLAVGLMNLGTFLTGEIALESVSWGFSVLLEGSWHSFS
jgi:hypothetical protein